jgi:hypothetical protein
MPAPDIPLFTDDDIPGNLDKVIWYLYSLADYLNEVSTDPSWSVTGTVVDTTLTSGDTLAATQNVLGTLINSLKEKGVI